MAHEADQRAAAVERAAAPRGLQEESVPPPRKTERIEVSDLEEPLDEPLDEPARASDPVPAAPAAPVREPVTASEDRRPGTGAPVVAAAPPAPAPPVAPAEDGPSGFGVQGGSTHVSPTAQALYDQGYSLYHQGQYVEAEETFQRFLAAFGATDLGDNAQFWIGQCRLGRNELQSALAAFRQTDREHPTGNKVPDALLAAGGVLERLGDIDGARSAYRDVERRFPDNPASAEAARRRQRLEGR